MPLRVDQPAAMEPGHASLIGQLAATVDAASADVAFLRFQGGSPEYLDPTSGGWVAGERWFRPDAVRSVGADVAVDLGPATTWLLAPFTPYVFKVRDGVGVSLEERFSWAPIRLPSIPPKAGVPDDPAPSTLQAATEFPESAPAAGGPTEPLGLQEEPVAALATMTEPAVGEATPEPAGSPAPASRGGRRWLALAAALVIVAAGALGAYLLLDDVAPASTEAGVPLDLDGARAFLTSEPAPDAEAALAEAQRFAAATAHDGAFLLYRYAARKGAADAAFAIGRYYDPETFDAGRGPVANADAATALEWYEQAADAGHQAAMLQAATLLEAGDTGRTDAAAAARDWLQRAAAAGSADAQERIR
ncbi:MAG: hypothetical protein AAFX81_10520 [Pseudomonadota bacterium]